MMLSGVDDPKRPSTIDALNARSLGCPAVYLRAGIILLFVWALGVSTVRGQGEAVFWSDASRGAIYKGEVTSGAYQIFQRTQRPSAYAAGEEVLYWADGTTIRRRSAGGASDVSLIARAGTVSDIAVHEASNRIYWIGDNSLRRARLDGTGAQTILEDVGSVAALEIDTTDARLFLLVDGPFKGIVGVAPNGADRDTIVTSLARPRDLALDQTRSHLYWTDWVSLTRGLIRRVNFDGTGQETVIDSTQAVPVAVDGAGGRIYWGVADSIWSAGLNGANRALVLGEHGRHHFVDRIASLKWSRGRLYWENWGFPVETNIERLDPGESAVDTMVVGFRRPAGLSVDSLRGHLYWTAGQGKILRSELGGGKLTEVVEAPCGIGYFTDLVVDPTRGKMYWGHRTDCPSFDIYEADVDGDHLRIVKGYNQPWGLALDPERRELYWTRSNIRSIARGYVDSLFTRRRSTEVTRNVSTPWGIALNLERDWIYWTDKFRGTIERMRRDGSDRDTLVSGLDSPTDIALDVDQNQMIWIERGSGTIRRVSLDGTNVETLFSGLHEPEYLALTFATTHILSTEASENLPAEYRLYENYPNPFNPETTIRWSLPEPARVSLVIYDARGRTVARLLDRRLPAGTHTARFESSSLPSGVYFYRMQAGSFSATKSMMLVK